MKDSPSATQTISESGYNIEASGVVISDILEVATREFAAHGLAGARIEKIQQQTRTSKRMIYYHFGSKEGLYRAVIERAFELVAEQLEDQEGQVVAIIDIGATMTTLSVLVDGKTGMFGIHVCQNEMIGKVYAINGKVQ